MTAETAETGEVALASCSFCFHPSTEVGSLVAGPGVYICDACVALSQQIIDGKTTAPRPRMAPWDMVDDVNQVLTHLPLVARASALVEESLTQWVRRARALGATWARIGEALGMTRQSAWGRFSGEE
jgi:hypothetical protein